MNAEAKDRIEKAQSRIRKVMGWDEPGESPWMAERIRMLADGRASMIKTDHLEQIATELEQLKHDAECYRWIRSDGLQYVRVEELTCDTCDVGLDYAIEKRVEERNLLKFGDPFSGDDWERMQEVRAEISRIKEQK